MVVTRGSALQHNSPRKNCLVGAILGGKNVAESACLMHMPYTTALDIWKKYKKWVRHIISLALALQGL
jgi:hypothetical protein